MELANILTIPDSYIKEIMWKARDRAVAKSSIKMENCLIKASLRMACPMELDKAIKMEK